MPDVNAQEAAAQPVLDSENQGKPTKPIDGATLCLSGGGYRAMLFHVGVLSRLNEAGLLRRLTQVSSVSGGSITAALLSVVSSTQLNFGICLILNFCLKFLLKTELCLRRLARAVPANFSGKTEMATRAYFKSGEQIT